jgi:hypothetical protein
MVCLWTMVYAFPFRPLPLCSVILLLPLFVDIIIYIYINNCVVVFVIVSFIIDLLDLHFHIFGGRRGRDRMVVGFTTTCVISAFHHPLKFDSDLRQVSGFLHQ